MMRKLHHTFVLWPQRINNRYNTKLKQLQQKIMKGLFLFLCVLLSGRWTIVERGASGDGLHVKATISGQSRGTCSSREFVAHHTHRKSSGDHRERESPTQ